MSNKQSQPQNPMFTVMKAVLAVCLILIGVFIMQVIKAKRGGGGIREKYEKDQKTNPKTEGAKQLPNQ